MFNYFTISTYLNGRIDIQVRFRYGFIFSNNKELIENEKYEIYQKLTEIEKSPIRMIPSLEIDTVAVFDNAENERLVKILSSDERKNGLVYINKKSLSQLNASLSLSTERDESNLFKMFMEAAIDNEFNSHLAQFISHPELSRNLYVKVSSTGEELQPDKQYYESLVKAIQNWQSVKSLTNLQRALSLDPSSGFITRKSAQPQLTLQSWSSYMESKISYNNHLIDGEKYRIKIVNLDDESIDWRNLLSNYRRANPREERQFDYRLLDRASISIVLLSPRDNDKMIGYITGSLKVIYKRMKEAFHIEPLDLMREFLLGREDKRKYDGCGYDLFSIDGISVDHREQNQPRLVSILLYSILDFIRLSVDDLGVRLISSATYNYQIKNIMSNIFHFKFYNRLHEFSWFTHHLIDYTLSRQGQTTKYNTNPELLSLYYLFIELKDFYIKYFDDNRTENISSTQRKLDSALKTLRLFNLEYIDIEIEKNKETWPIHKDNLFKFPQSEYNAFISSITHIAIALKDDEEKSLSDRINLFINSNEIIQDSFLYIPGNAEFDRKMSLFPFAPIDKVEEMEKDNSLPIVEIHENRTEEEEEEENLLHNEMVSVKETEIDVVKRKKRIIKYIEDDDITERDMILYDFIANTVERDKAARIESIREAIKLKKVENEKERRRIDELKREMTEAKRRLAELKKKSTPPPDNNEKTEFV